MITNAPQDKPLPVYAQGLNVRDWLHVSDHCVAIDTIIQRGHIGEVYNVGGNNELPNIEVVRTILRELGKPTSLIKYVTDRPGHDLRYAIDASKMRDELGWEPSVVFEEGIRETIAWYCDHEIWWKNILSGEYLKREI